MTTEYITMIYIGLIKITCFLHYFSYILTPIDILYVVTFGVTISTD